MPYTFHLTRTFSFTEDFEIKWHGTRGGTVSKARAFDLGVVESFRPDTVILQLGSNVFVHGDPLSIASAIVFFSGQTNLCLPKSLSSIEPYI